MINETKDLVFLALTLNELAHQWITKSFGHPTSTSFRKPNIPFTSINLIFRLEKSPPVRAVIEK